MTDPLPARTSINPADLLHMLPQIFMAGRTEAGLYRIRLAGGFVAELHGADLRGQNMLEVWEPIDREPIERALNDARRRAFPLVISADATTEDSLIMSLEVVMAPLIGPSGDADRLVGLYQPTSPVAALRGRSVRHLAARSLRSATTAVRTINRLRLATVDGLHVA